MSEVVGDSVGTTPAMDRLSIDSALADWVYHRKDVDQGLSLADISPDARMNYGLSRTQLNTYSLVRGGDGFIYNVADGFTAAVANFGGVYTIVYRGTDIASYSLGGFDGGDINADVTIGSGTRGTPSQAADAVNLAKLVIDLAGGATSRARLGGPSSCPAEDARALRHAEHAARMGEFGGLVFGRLPRRFEAGELGHDDDFGHADVVAQQGGRPERGDFAPAIADDRARPAGLRPVRLHEGDRRQRLAGRHRPDDGRP